MDKISNYQTSKILRADIKDQFEAAAIATSWTNEDMATVLVLDLRVTISHYFTHFLNRVITILYLS